MHLFQNKKKDVKQFLEEVKANRTNKSSNQSSNPKSFEGKQHKIIKQESNHADQNLNNRQIPKKILTQSSIRSASRDCSSNGSNMSSNGSNSQFMRNSNQKQMNLGSFQRFSQTPNIYANSYQNNQYLQEPRNEMYNHFPQTQLSYQPYTHYSNPLYQQQQQQSMHINQGISQRHPYSNQFYQSNIDSRNKSNDLNRSFSQTSNSTVYQSAQYYDNLNFSNELTNYSNQDQKVIQMRNRNNNYSRNSSLVNQRSSKVNHGQKQQLINQLNFSYNNQRLTQPQVHKRQMPNTYLKHTNFDRDHPLKRQSIQKRKQSFSQQVQNQCQLKRSCFSQISYPQYNLSMEEIREAEPGLSTEKDSPPKLTDVESKVKFIEEIQQFGAQTLFRSAVESAVHKLDHYDLEKKRFSSKASNEKSIFQALYEVQQQTSQNLEFQDSKIEFQTIYQHPKVFKSHEHKPPVHITVNQEQKMTLKRGFNNLFNLRVKVNDIEKQVSIGLENILRSKSNFEFQMKNPKGKFYNLFNQEKSFSRRIVPQMEMEKMQIQVPLRECQNSAKNQQKTVKVNRKMEVKNPQWCNQTLKKEFKKTGTKRI